MSDEKNNLPISGQVNPYMPYVMEKSQRRAEKYFTWAHEIETKLAPMHENDPSYQRYTEAYQNMYKRASMLGSNNNHAKYVEYIKGMKKFTPHFDTSKYGITHDGNTYSYKPKRGKAISFVIDEETKKALSNIESSFDKADGETILGKEGYKRALEFYESKERKTLKPATAKKNAIKKLKADIEAMKQDPDYRKRWFLTQLVHANGVNLTEKQIDTIMKDAGVPGYLERTKPNQINRGASFKQTGKFIKLAEKINTIMMPNREDLSGLVGVENVTPLDIQHMLDSKLYRNSDEGLFSLQQVHAELKRKALHKLNKASVLNAFDLHPDIELTGFNGPMYDSRIHIPEFDQWVLTIQNNLVKQTGYLSYAINKGVPTTDNRAAMLSYISSNFTMSPSVTSSSSESSYPIGDIRDARPYIDYKRRFFSKDKTSVKTVSTIVGDEFLLDARGIEAYAKTDDIIPVSSLHEKRIHDLVKEKAMSDIEKTHQYLITDGDKTRYDIFRYLHDEGYKFTYTNAGEPVFAKFGTDYVFADDVKPGETYVLTDAAGQERHALAQRRLELMKERSVLRELRSILLRAQREFRKNNPYEYLTGKEPITLEIPESVQRALNLNKDVRLDELVERIRLQPQTIASQDILENAHMRLNMTPLDSNTPFSHATGILKNLIQETEEPHQRYDGKLAGDTVMGRIERQLRVFDSIYDNLVEERAQIRDDAQLGVKTPHMRHFFNAQEIANQVHEMGLSILAPGAGGDAEDDEWLMKQKMYAYLGVDPKTIQEHSRLVEAIDPETGRTVYKYVTELDQEILNKIGYDSKKYFPEVRPMDMYRYMSSAALHSYKSYSLSPDEYDKYEIGEIKNADGKMGPDYTITYVDKNGAQQHMKILSYDFDELRNATNQLGPLTGDQLAYVKNLNMLHEQAGKAFFVNRGDLVPIQFEADGIDAQRGIVRGTHVHTLFEDIARIEFDDDSFKKFNVTSALYERYAEKVASLTYDIEKSILDSAKETGPVHILFTQELADKHFNGKQAQEFSSAKEATQVLWRLMSQQSEYSGFSGTGTKVVGSVNRAYLPTQLFDTATRFAPTSINKLEHVDADNMLTTMYISLQNALAEKKTLDLNGPSADIGESLANDDLVGRIMKEVHSPFLKEVLNFDREAQERRQGVYRLQHLVKQARYDLINKYDSFQTFSPDEMAVHIHRFFQKTGVAEGASLKYSHYRGLEDLTQMDIRRILEDLDSTNDKHISYDYLQDINARINDRDLDPDYNPITRADMRAEDAEGNRLGRLFDASRQAETSTGHQVREMIAFGSRSSMDRGVVREEQLTDRAMLLFNQLREAGAIDDRMHEVYVNEWLNGAKNSIFDDPNARFYTDAGKYIRVLSDFKDKYKDETFYSIVDSRIAQRLLQEEAGRLKLQDTLSSNITEGDVRNLLEIQKMFPEFRLRAVTNDGRRFDIIEGKEGDIMGRFYDTGRYEMLVRNPEQAKTSFGIMGVKPDRFIYMGGERVNGRPTNFVTGDTPLVDMKGANYHQLTHLFSDVFLDHSPAESFAGIRALRKGAKGIVLDMETMMLPDDVNDPVKQAWVTEMTLQHVKQGAGGLDVVQTDHMMFKPTAQNISYLQEVINNLQNKALTEDEFLQDKDVATLRNIAKYSGSDMARKWANYDNDGFVRGANLINLKESLIADTHRALENFENLDAEGWRGLLNIPKNVNLQILNQNAIEDVVVPTITAKNTWLIGQNFANAEHRMIEQAREANRLNRDISPLIRDAFNEFMEAKTPNNNALGASLLHANWAQGIIETVGHSNRRINANAIKNVYFTEQANREAFDSFVTQNGVYADDWKEQMNAARKRLFLNFDLADSLNPSSNFFKIYTGSDQEERANFLKSMRRVQRNAAEDVVKNIFWAGLVDHIGNESNIDTVERMQNVMQQYTADFENDFSKNGLQKYIGKWKETVDLPDEAFDAVPNVIKTLRPNQVQAITRGLHLEMFSDRNGSSLMSMVKTSAEPKPMAPLYTKAIEIMHLAKHLYPELRGQENGGYSLGNMVDKIMSQRDQELAQSYLGGAHLSYVDTDVQRQLFNHMLDELGDNIPETRELNIGDLVYRAGSRGDVGERGVYRIDGMEYNGDNVSVVLRNELDDSVEYLTGRGDEELRRKFAQNFIALEPGDTAQEFLDRLQWDDAREAISNSQKEYHSMRHHRNVLNVLADELGGIENVTAENIMGLDTVKAGGYIVNTNYQKDLARFTELGKQLMEVPNIDEYVASLGERDRQLLYNSDYFNEDSIKRNLLIEMDARKAREIEAGKRFFASAHADFMENALSQVEDLKTAGLATREEARDLIRQMNERIREKAQTSGRAQTRMLNNAISFTLDDRFGTLSGDNIVIRTNSVQQIHQGLESTLSRMMRSTVEDENGVLTNFSPGDMVRSQLQTEGLDIDEQTVKKRLINQYIIPFLKDQEGLQDVFRNVQTIGLDNASITFSHIAEGIFNRGGWTAEVDNNLIPWFDGVPSSEAELASYHNFVGAISGERDAVINNFILDKEKTSSMHLYRDDMEAPQKVLRGVQGFVAYRSLREVRREVGDVLPGMRIRPSVHRGNFERMFSEKDWSTSNYRNKRFAGFNADELIALRNQLKVLDQDKFDFANTAEEAKAMAEPLFREQNPESVNDEIRRMIDEVYAKGDSRKRARDAFHATYREAWKEIYDRTLMLTPDSAFTHLGINEPSLVQAAQYHIDNNNQEALDYMRSMAWVKRNDNGDYYVNDIRKWMVPIGRQTRKTSSVGKMMQESIVGHYAEHQKLREVHDAAMSLGMINLRDKEQPTPHFPHETPYTDEGIYGKLDERKAILDEARESRAMEAIKHGLEDSKSRPYMKYAGIAGLGVLGALALYQGLQQPGILQPVSTQPMEDYGKEWSAHENEAWAMNEGSGGGVVSTKPIESGNPMEVPAGGYDINISGQTSQDISARRASQGIQNAVRNHLAPNARISVQTTDNTTKINKQWLERQVTDLMNNGYAGGM